MNIRTGPYQLEIDIYEPMYYGPLTIYPVNTSDAESNAIGLRQAIDSGDLEIREVSEAGRVNTLLAVNRGKHRVLILDGEELIGAKQNRILNTTVLLEAESETKLPVSCVEAHRWGYKSRNFASSDQFMPYSNRSRKSARMHYAMESRKMYDADQGAIWADIDHLHAKHKTHSNTAAMSDAFAARKDVLDKAVAALGRCIMQNGLIVFQRGQFVAFEYISSRSVFAEVYNKLIRSLAMDYINEDAEYFKEIEVEPAHIQEVLAHLEGLERMDIQPVGLGQDYRLREEQYVGSMLHHEDEQHHVTLQRVEMDRARIKKKREMEMGPDERNERPRRQDSLIRRWAINVPREQPDHMDRLDETPPF